MGDLKPSDFFRKLETQCGDSKLVNKELLQKIWLKRLPTALKNAIAAWVDKDISELTPIADKIWEYIAKPTVISEASTSNSSRNQTNHDNNNDTKSLERQLKETKDELSDMRRLMSKLEIGRRGRSPHRSYSRNRRFSRSRTRSNSRYGDLCYYHGKFGSKARKCRKPCKYTKNSSSSSSQSRSYSNKHSENH